MSEPHDKAGLHCWCGAVHVVPSQHHHPKCGPGECHCSPTPLLPLLPTRCISCRGRYPSPPPFQDGEQLRDCVWVEPSGTVPDVPQYLRGWICTECYVFHWAWEYGSQPAV